LINHLSPKNVQTPTATTTSPKKFFSKSVIIENSTETPKGADIKSNGLMSLITETENNKRPTKRRNTQIERRFSTCTLIEDDESCKILSFL